MDRRTILLIIVAAMGYFVDIYDLVLFNVVKRESLEFIMGVGNARIKEVGAQLFNVVWTLLLAWLLFGGILFAAPVIK